jgi:DtxR family Mn-dependent transcriptional regulator
VPFPEAGADFNVFCNYWLFSLILFAFCKTVCYPVVNGIYTLLQAYPARNEMGMIVLKIRESAEMYLETILILSRKDPQVRSVDIANELNYRKSSISVAMKKLRENGYIQIDDEGYITLTGKGKKIAETMLERHTFIANWLMSLGVDETIAFEDACRIEHVISHESFEVIKKHIEIPENKDFDDLKPQ